MLSKRLLPNKKQIGQLAEQTACTYLQKQGLRLIERNFQCFHGEIDLIMVEPCHPREGGDPLWIDSRLRGNDTVAQNQQVIFVEVRHRARVDYGTALESVDYNKMRRLVKTATLYLQKRRLLYKVSSRFDVITLQGTLGKPEIEWIKNAFTVDY